MEQKLLLACIGSLLLLLTSCLEMTGGEKKTEKQIRKVDCLTIQHHKVQENIPIQGIVYSYQQADLAFRLPGVVLSTPSYLGHKVRKGEVLATMEDVDFQLQLAKATENQNLAKANLRKVKAGARAEEIQGAKAKLKSARKAYEYSQKYYESQINLRKSNILSDLDLDKLRTDAEMKQENVEMAEQELLVLQKGSRIEDVLSASAQVALADVEVKVAKQNLNYVQIESPFSGIVSQYAVEIGEFLPAGKVVVVVHNLYKVKLKIHVSEEQVSHLVLGQRANIKINALNNTTIGKVTYISHVADNVSRTFLVEITIPNKNLKIRSGMFATGSIVLQKSNKLVLLPPKCILRDYDGDYVYLLSREGEKAQVTRQAVVLGKIKGNRVVVKEGLKDGDLVISAGQHYIRNNDVVQYEIVDSISTDKKEI